MERARCDMLCQYAAASAPSISPEEGLLSLCFISHHIFQRSDITALEGCSDVRHGLAGEMRLIPAPSGPTPTQGLGQIVKSTNRLFIKQPISA